MFTSQSSYMNHGSTRKSETSHFSFTVFQTSAVVRQGEKESSDLFNHFSLLLSPNNVFSLILCIHFRPNAFRKKHEVISARVNQHYHALPRIQLMRETPNSNRGERDENSQVSKKRITKKKSPTHGSDMSLKKFSVY